MKSDDPEWVEIKAKATELIELCHQTDPIVILFAVGLLRCQMYDHMYQNFNEEKATVDDIKEHIESIESEIGAWVDKVHEKAEKEI